MRKVKILFLLLVLSLISVVRALSPIQNAVADSVPGDCDRDLVQHDSKVEIRDPNLQFTYPHAVCRDEKEHLYVSGKYYKNLQCDKSVGWKGWDIYLPGNVRLNISPRAKITIECRVKTCDPYFLDVDESTEISFDFASPEYIRRNKRYPSSSEYPEDLWMELERKKMRVLSCKDGWRLRFNGQYISKEYDQMECNIDESIWPSMGFAGDARVKVECIEVCKWRTESGETGISDGKKSDLSDYAHCKPTEHFPRFVVVRYKDTYHGYVYATGHTYLMCGQDEGWMDEKGRSLGAPPSDTLLTILCEQYCFHETDTPDLVAEPIVNQDDLTISCKNKLMFVIQPAYDVTVEPAASIRCTLRGAWVVDGTSRQIFGDPTKPFKYNCTEGQSCTFTSDENLDVVDSNEQRTIKCKDGYVLSIKKWTDSNQRDAVNGPLTCDVPNGWRDATGATLTPHKRATIELDSACTPQ